MLGGQFGYRGSFDNGMRLTAGFSYYDYLQTQGQTPFWDAAPAGNRVDVLGNYLNDFNDAELFAGIGDWNTLNRTLLHAEAAEFAGTLKRRRDDPPRRRRRAIGGAGSGIAMPARRR